jgi:hydroxymethylpyrimidine/phosphomethylpyrimidine kinase
MAPLDGVLVAEQARAVLEDMPVAAIKIGLLGSADIVESLHAVLVDYPDIPVVLDPVMATGAGTGLADDEILEAMDSLLLPFTTVLTPNSMEARILAPEADNLDACAMAILEREVEFLLITGTHENTEHVVNKLYSNHRLLESFTWERLPGSYHGSGCTLAASIAGLLAQGLEPFTAVHEAQEYTWEALKHGYRVGMGQVIPNRLFWTRGESD